MSNAINPFRNPLLLGFLSLIFSSAIYSQSRSPDLLPINYFHVGEYAKYKVIYKFSEAWVHAGQVTFELSERAVNGKPHLVCIAKGNTSPAFDLFYKVRDEYASVFDPISILPKYFLRRVNEGGFKIFNDFDFMHDSLKVKVEMQDSKNPHRVDSFKTAPNTQDIVSALLYCRSLNYSKLDSGQSYSFPLFIDNELHQIGIRYLGKTNLSTEYGDHNCLVLQPMLLTGRVFSDANQMRIYVTDDAQRIPVYIESPLRVGKVIAILTKYRK